MPTYQYACTACGHQLEAVQSFSDEPLTQCPSCEGRLRKLFNSVGIVFKGSGFYRTDSRANGSESPTAGKPAAKSESSSSSGGDSATKSDGGSGSSDPAKSTSTSTSSSSTTKSSSAPAASGAS
ncbi:FmdB family zinc ribbon protein [Micromonospora zhanjiangensis]|uniref:FmdB family zinc ribbon protein n=1 Tax=Micromonospora zhanjiangensis TaxID=1522057 RepID=A0ABV8KF55_9ACTN